MGGRRRQATEGVHFTPYKTPLMIKPNNRALGAKGKQANLATLVGNAPLLPTAPPPEGEVYSPLTLVLT